MGKENENNDTNLNQPKQRAERILDRLSLPLSVLSGTSQMEIVGNKEITLDGAQGVLEYTDDCIRVSTGKMAIKISGRNLSLKGLNNETLIITGYILSIEFI